MPHRLVSLALVTVLACSGEPSTASPSADEARTATKPETATEPEPKPPKGPEPATDPKVVPLPQTDPVAEPTTPKVDASGEGATGNVVTLTDDTKTTPPVTVGDEVVVELRGSSHGISPEYRYRWGDASLTGDALTFVKLETRRPPPDVDGGHDTLRYRFRAERPGTATITIPVAERGAEAFAEDFRKKVTVDAR